MVITWFTQSIASFSDIGQFRWTVWICRWSPTLPYTLDIRIVSILAIHNLIYITITVEFSVFTRLLSLSAWARGALGMMLRRLFRTIALRILETLAQYSFRRYDPSVITLVQTTAFGVRRIAVGAYQSRPVATVAQNRFALGHNGRGRGSGRCTISEHPPSHGKRARESIGSSSEL